MRALALVAFLLVQSIEPLRQEAAPYHGDPSKHPRCASIEKDLGELKACACAAASGSPEFCDKDGNRIVESMPNCRNRAHWKVLVLSQGLTGAKRLFRRPQRFPEQGHGGVMVALSDVLNGTGHPIKLIRTAAINPDWFWSYVEKIPFHDCWEWNGIVTPKGYGTYCQEGGRAIAHRVAWALTHGDTPANLLVCHRCDNPSCVRPDHLFLGTVKDNAQDARQKGRLGAAQRDKTHCKRGHPLSGANVRFCAGTAGPRRHCLTCQALLRESYKTKPESAIPSEVA